MPTITRVPLESLRLSTRSHNALRRAGYDYIDQIAGKSIDDLLFIRDIGQQSADEIVQAIDAYRRVARG